MTDLKIGLDTSGVWKGPEAARAQGQKEQAKKPSLDGIKTLLHQALGQIGKLEEAQESGLVLPLSKIENAEQLKQRLIDDVNAGRLPREMVDETGKLTINSKTALELLSTAVSQSQRDRGFAELLAKAIFNSVAKKSNTQLSENMDSHENNFRFHVGSEAHMMSFNLERDNGRYGTQDHTWEGFNRYFSDHHPDRTYKNDFQTQRYWMMMELLQKEKPDLSGIPDKLIEDLKGNAREYIERIVYKSPLDAQGLKNLVNFVNNISNSSVLNRVDGDSRRAA